ncbi:unnamed protein product [Polarella glacialis]|uniref:Uncharacterized protein n=1 Tax=Polarella glacialis TaxID=89957 RepID=A0A813FG09_POLGL|nr:unnamed protein product [Polarella glacialis]
MWLLAGGGEGTDGNAESDSEAEERRLKLEALHSAEQREQLRATWRSRRDPSEVVEHFSLEEDGCAAPSPEECELDAMYDFSRFIPQPNLDRDQPDAEALGKIPASSSSSSPSRTTRRKVASWPEDANVADGEEGVLRRAEAVEALLQEQQLAIEAQMQDQERKLVTASTSLKRSKMQAQQLTAQLGFKDLQGSRLLIQVTQLRALLVDKERRLQDALDAAEAQTSCSGGSVCSVCSGCSGRLTRRSGAEAWDAVDERSQQPQEPPSATAADRGPDNEGQLVHLARVTEELTEALQDARDSEESARRQLCEAAAKLQAEQRTREQYEAELAASKAQHEAEVAQLVERLRQAQEGQAALELQRARELLLQERATRNDIEEKLQQALARKGRSPLDFHSHFEV